MIVALMFLFGSGFCWKSADNYKGIVRAEVYAFALSFLFCGILGMYGWMGAL